MDPTDENNGDGANVEGGGVDWGAMNEGVDAGNDDGNHEDLHGEPDGGNAPAPAPAPAPKPAPAPAPAAAPGANTPTDPEATPENPEGVQPQEPADPDGEEAPVQLTPEQIEERKQQYEAWRGKELERLEAEYQFSPEDAALLQTEPEKVLPKMAAQLFMQVQEAAIRTVVQGLPGLIGQVTTHQNRDQQAANEFFAANPDLKKHGKDVVPFAQEFRRRYPKATPQEVIAGTARMIRAAHNLAQPEAGAPTPAPAPAPAGKKAPAPHKPAGTGGRTAAPKVAEPNVWADLAGDDD